jgi:hypothetical protein
LVGCKGIIEEADEGIDQKDSEESPDGGVTKPSPDIYPGPNTGLV